MSTFCGVASCSLETGGTSAEGTVPGGGDVDPDDPTPPDDGDPPDVDEPVEVPRDGGRPTTDGGTSSNQTKGPCKAGRYEGTYECISKMTGIGLGGPATQSVSGPVRFTLVQSTNDEDTFEFVDGEFLASPNAFQTASAKIDATLVCGEPFSGALIQGQLSGLFGLGGSSFGSSLQAGYDGRSATFTDGSWTIRPDINNAGCAGTWSARFVGP